MASGTFGILSVRLQVAVVLKIMSDSSIPTLPPPGQVLLVTDELASPADFILYRSLAAHFKGAAGKSTSARCLVVSVSGNLAKWKAVLTKSVRFESLAENRKDPHILI